VSVAISYTNSIRHAVAVGSSSISFEGPLHSYVWRERFLTRWNIEAPTITKDNFLVTILDRIPGRTKKRDGRTFENVPELLSLLDKYNLDYVYLTFDTPPYNVSQSLLS